MICYQSGGHQHRLNIEKPSHLTQPSQDRRHFVEKNRILTQHRLPFHLDELGSSHTYQKNTKTLYSSNNKIKRKKANSGFFF